MIAATLMVASAGIILTLGLIHLTFTFRGAKLRPRDPALTSAMNATHMVLTRETTVWRAWIGFNASHSLGAVFFGVIYGYLASMRRELLFHSPFLLAVGLLTLASYAVLARRYWFSAPFRGICLALVLFLAAIVASLRLY